MDQYFMNRTGNKAIQLELQYDYRNNIKHYAGWHRYFRKYQPPTLVVWGLCGYSFRFIRVGFNKTF
jgi:hypothetical protein